MAITTIFKKDGTVTVDGFFTTDQDFSKIESNIHAIQWNTSTNKGTIEYNDDTANEDITSIDSDMQKLIDDCQATKTASEAADAKVISDAANEKTALESTYSWKREQEYPPISEQSSALTYKDETSEDFLDHLLMEVQLHVKYGTMGDMLDKLYHAGKFNSDMTAKLKAVKDKYPKS